MNFNSLKILVCLLSACSVNICIAGEVDLELQMDIDISEFVEFQQTGTFTVTLTNHGPDDAGAESLGTYPVAVQSKPIKMANNGFINVSFSKNENIAQNCVFGVIVGDPPPNGVVSYSFGVYLTVLPANSSITCYGNYHIGFEQGIKYVEWVARSALDIDPNSTNNSVVFTFSIAPKIIPTTNLITLLLLMGFILIFGYKNRI